MACSRDASPPAAPAPAPVAAQPQPASEGSALFLHDVTAFIDPGGKASRRPVMELVAVLHSTSTGRPIGTTRMRDRGHAGLDLVTIVDELPPGRHAYHVHVFGDCSSPDAKSAGPHFHFTGSSFEPNVDFVTGDLGELVADPEGRAIHQVRRPLAKIHGAFSLIGRSVVIHEDPNDPSAPPDGAAGARIACGVIGIANPSPPSRRSAGR